MDQEAISVIPLWCRVNDGMPVDFSLTENEGSALFTNRIHNDVADVNPVYPMLLIYHTPAEARAAAATFLHTIDNGANLCSVGATRSGEGILMRPALNDKSELAIWDLRTPNGYLQCLLGSWEVDEHMARQLLAAPEPDRVDMAAYIVKSIAETANANLIRAVQNGIEALPGANVGMPSLSSEDLLADLEFSEDLDPAVLQREFLQHAARLDASQTIDGLVRHLRNQLRETVKPAAWNDGLSL